MRILVCSSTKDLRTEWHRLRLSLRPAIYVPVKFNILACTTGSYATCSLVKMKNIKLLPAILKALGYSITSQYKTEYIYANSENYTLVVNPNTNNIQLYEIRKGQK